MSQSGFTLIEAMITLFVIAIGLLGMASLTAFGVGSSHTSYLRSIAAVHAENMAERMRANTAGVDNNNYASIDFDSLDPKSTPSPDCRGTTSCTANQLAQADALHWLNAVDRDLPADPAGGDPQADVQCADGSTTCGAGGTPHIITVRWLEKSDIEDQAQPIVQEFRMVFKP